MSAEVELFEGEETSELRASRGPRVGKLARDQTRRVKPKKRKNIFFPMHPLPRRKGWCFTSKEPQNSLPCDQPWVFLLSCFQETRRHFPYWNYFVQGLSKVKLTPQGIHLR